MSKSDVQRRPIPTFKVDPRAERVNICVMTTFHMCGEFSIKPMQPIVTVKISAKLKTDMGRY